MSKHKRLVIAICVVAMLVIAAAAFLFMTTPKPAVAVGYTIYVNDDGSATISINSINNVVQLHKDVEVAGKIFKAGTVILPGNGDEIYYEYTRKDTVIK
jgi:hypothetical protein|nr:MAG TPA: hypothetical protein [Caudoviricetes sp.]